MNIVFAGTPIFAAHLLQALLETPHTIKAVYTQPDKPQGRGLKLTPSPVKALANAHNIPVEQPLSLKTPESFSRLKTYAPDVMIVAAYGLLLPKNILDLPTHGCINIHYSLLPAWRGASPVQCALLNNEPQTGVTFMQMNEGLDTGDILLKKEHPITDEDTTESLLTKLSHLAAGVLKTQFEDIVFAPRIPQDDSKASYAPKIDKKSAQLDWSKDAFVLAQEVKAFYPWPIAYILHQNNPIKVYRAVAHSDTAQAEPGTIIKITSNSFYVACAQNVLEIFEVQFPGKKRLSVKDILNAKQNIITLGHIL